MERLEDTISGVIHVGAHRGEELGEHVAAGAKKIVWIEANPDVYQELLVNLKGSDIENNTFCVACSDVDDKTIEFNVVYGPDAGYMTGNKGCSSMLKPTGRFIPWHQNTIMVDTITLDTLLARNNLDPADFQLLEIDVQGAELLVLAGARNLLKIVKYVYLEVTYSDPDYIGNATFDDIRNFLKGYGFTFKRVDLQAPNWGDALFVKEQND